MPGCQPGDAGAIPADRTKFPKTRRAPARSKVSKTWPDRGGTETPCFFFNQLRSRQVGRQRPHKPPTRGFDSRLRYFYRADLVAKRGYCSTGLVRLIRSSTGELTLAGFVYVARLPPAPFPPPLNLSGCSIIQEVIRLASGRARCKAVAVHPMFQPRVGSRVKSAGRL